MVESGDQEQQHAGHGEKGEQMVPDRDAGEIDDQQQEALAPLGVPPTSPEHGRPGHPLPSGSEGAYRHAAAPYNGGDIVVPTVDFDGITTHYEMSGSGPPILMMAPGGFDSAIEKWSTTWPWQHFLPLQTFARAYTCIAYDRREAGQSGGRVGQLTRKYTEGTPWTLAYRANMRS